MTAHVVAVAFICALGLLCYWRLERAHRRFERDMRALSRSRHPSARDRCQCGRRSNPQLVHGDDVCQPDRERIP